MMKPTPPMPSAGTANSIGMPRPVTRISRRYVGWRETEGM